MTVEFSQSYYEAVEGGSSIQIGLNVTLNSAADTIINAFTVPFTVQADRTTSSKLSIDPDWLIPCPNYAYEVCYQILELGL